MQIVFWLALAAALAVIVVWSALEWERDGKWRPCLCGRKYMMRRWFGCGWQYRLMTPDEEADFFSREAW